ncbi:MAG: apolipoprotein N-acyltransferase [Planctomycetota bacterium]
MSAKKRKSKSSGASKREKAKAKASNDSGAKQAVWPAYVSALLLWLSFAPAQFSFLAWIAPIGWLSFVGREKLGRREYLHLWLSGSSFWLGTLEGIRLAFWALYLGWVALSLYLAVYIPLFVGLTRALVRRKVPLALAGPLIWVGLEFFRSYMITGFCANMLAHTQVPHPWVIQIADQFGAYGISFVVMSVAVGIFEASQFRKTLPAPSVRETPSPNGSGRLALLLPGILLGGTLAYGQYKVSEGDALAAEREPLLRVLLVQENTPTMFDVTDETVMSSWLNYLDATRREASKHGGADLVVWPESTFTAGVPWVEPELPDQLPSVGGTQMERARAVGFIDKTMREIAFRFSQVGEAGAGVDLGPNAEAKRSHLLLGCDSLRIEPDRIHRFNSALCVNSSGELVDKYDKVHRVMFGEYFPLGPLLQFLREIFSTIDAGNAPKSFDVKGVLVSPNICFESMMPRVIQRQVAELADSSAAPDLLVNLSNDSWFHGSAMLDHHLACSILVAVENRRPLVAAANTGISAEIDGCGRVVQRTEKYAVTGLLAEPKADGRGGLVQSLGYPLGWAGLLAVLIASVLIWPFRKNKA